MKKIKVDVVVPAYNEGENLEKNIKMIHSAMLKNMSEFSWRILIGENGSKDNSYEIAKRLAKKHKEIKAFHFDIGSKDNAIKSLWMKSDADVKVFTDADNSADPKFIADLVKGVGNGHDIAAGNRFHSKENSRGFYRDSISKIYNGLLLPLILPTGTNDTQCGFKAVSKRLSEDVVPLLGKENGFFDSELLGVARHKGYKVKAVPITWKETRQSVLSVNKNIPNFLKNIVKTRVRIMKGHYD